MTVAKRGLVLGVAWFVCFLSALPAPVSEGPLAAALGRSRRDGALRSAPGPRCGVRGRRLLRARGGRGGAGRRVVPRERSRGRGRGLVPPRCRCRRSGPASRVARCAQAAAAPPSWAGRPAGHRSLLPRARCRRSLLPGAPKARFLRENAFPAVCPAQMEMDLLSLVGTSGSLLGLIY